VYLRQILILIVWGRHVVRIFTNPNASTVDVNKLIHNYLLVEVAFLYDDYMNFLAEQDLDKLLSDSVPSNQVSIASIKKILGQYVSARDSFAQILGARKNLRKDEVSVKKIQALY
jgi:hypothetical protein